MKFIFTLSLLFLINFTSSNIYCQSREDLRRELLNVYRDIEKQLEDEIDLLVININESLNEIRLIKAKAKKIELEADSMKFYNDFKISQINTDVDSLLYDTKKNAEYLISIATELTNYSETLTKITMANIEEIRDKIEDLSLKNDNIFIEKKEESKSLLDNANKLNKNIKKDSDIGSIREHLNFIKDRIKELEEN
ncbi:MAG: hypothetical protein CMF98_01130 [Candidatus Marinimicrobia bacterium]|nr:hypothetical protein [Candidatus Neomarinimicrobiota bacterium]|tara:strand:+ start:816 stop:1400 length:585 start_codon:yes stop_codon:yes gene_type:complete